MLEAFMNKHILICFLSDRSILSLVKESHRSSTFVHTRVSEVQLKSCDIWVFLAGPSAKIDNEDHDQF